MPTNTKADPAKGKAKPKPKKKKDDGKLPVRTAAEVVLLQNGKPMHYREVSRVMLEKALIKVPRGHKPEQTEKTVRSFLAGCAQLDVKVVRVDAGVFDLKERPERKPTLEQAIKKVTSKT